jgi:hypothetical protein
VRGEGHGRLGAAVVRVAQTDYFAVAGVFATHQDGDFVGFAPRVGEVITGQPAACRHMFSHLLAILADGGVQVNGGGMLEFAQLGGDLFDHSRMAVPHADGDDSGERVEILLAGFVPHVLHVPLGNEQRLLVESEQAGREVIAPQGQHLVA